MTNIPIKEAQTLADAYDFDQVMIVARKTGDDGFEHVVTYGKGRDHCNAAARAGMAIKHHLMQWPAALFESALQITGVARDHHDEHIVQLFSRRPVSDAAVTAIRDFVSPPTKSPRDIDQGA